MRQFIVVGPRPSPYPDPKSRSSVWEPGPYPAPRVLILEDSEEGGTIIYRYTADGQFGGDEWYESQELAKASCFEEFCTDPLQWQASDASDLQGAIDQALVYAVSR